MATHSSVLAWRTPGWQSLGGCRLWGCTQLDTTEVTSQHQTLRGTPGVSTIVHCGVGSLYLLCFSGRLDSLDLQCLAGRAGEVLGECLTDLKLSLKFCF